MNKDDSIRIKISSEKKQLWKDYCKAHGYRLNLTKLIEYAVDDRVAGRTKYKNDGIDTGIYWVLNPTGKERDKYDNEVLLEGGNEIKRLAARGTRMREA